LEAAHPEAQVISVCASVVPPDPWRGSWLFAIFALLTILNFFAFVAVATYLGGDAVNGKREAGHCYLFGTRSINGKKVYTEVSESVFDIANGMFTASL
jgi:hypothetical protein